MSGKIAICRSEERACATRPRPRSLIKPSANFPLYSIRPHLSSTFITLFGFSVRRPTSHPSRVTRCSSSPSLPPPPPPPFSDMRFAIWITALAVISKALSQINLEPPQDNRLLDGPFALVGALPLARITGWTGERLQRRAKTTSTLRKPTSPSASKKVSSSSPTPTAPPLAAAACAPSMVASVTINGTGTLPRPTSFVKRSGQRLNLDGKPFRIVGTNMWGVSATARGHCVADGVSQILVVPRRKSSAGQRVD